MQVKASLTVGQLVELIMKAKGISRKQLALELGVSQPDVTMKLNASKNHMVETVQKIFKAIDEDFIVLDQNMELRKIENMSVNTMSQLRKRLGKVYFQFTNGSVYEILPFDHFDPVDNF